MPMLTSNGFPSLEAPSTSDSGNTATITMALSPFVCAHRRRRLGDCVYVLNLFDSWDDGWGSSNVGYRSEFRARGPITP